jgi:hypothetical protein
MTKYKEFKTWALKNGWFFLKEYNGYYWWFSPIGLSFYMKVVGDDVQVFNTCIETSAG